MNQILQFFVSYYWILIPILIGLFNFGVRIQQKAKEQRARREMQSELVRRKAEALRTGRPVDEPVVAYERPNEPKPLADDRQARIEALRQQRMEQLRAMRERRSSSSGTATPPRQMPMQQPRSIGPTTTPTRTQPGRPKPQARPRVIPAAPSSGTNRPPNRPMAMPKSNPPRFPQPQQRPTQIARPAAPTARPQTPQAQPTSAAAQPLTSAEVLTPRGATRTQNADAPMRARDLLRDRRHTRQAIVINELLGQPIALRDPDSGPGSVQG